MGVPFDDELEHLRAENEALKVEVQRLRQAQSSSVPEPRSQNDLDTPSTHSWDGLGHGLSRDDIARYSRQIILPSFGAQGALSCCFGGVPMYIYQHPLSRLL